MILKILVGTGILLSIVLLPVALVFLEFKLKQLLSFEFAQKAVIVLITMLFLCLAYNIGDALI